MASKATKNQQNGENCETCALYIFIPAKALNETLAQVFSCEFCEIFKNTFFTEHLQRLLLRGLELLFGTFLHLTDQILFRILISIYELGRHTQGIF